MDPISRAQNSDTLAKKPIGRPFVKGKSGNPGGRPKKKPVTEMFQELLDAGEVREQVKDRMRKTLTEKGMAGVLLLKEAAERTEGKVAQEVEMNVTGTIALAEAIHKRRKAAQ